MAKTPEYKLGDIWTVGVLQLPAVIVCVYQEPRGAVDVRVVPLAADADRVSLASDHDVIIPAAHIVLDSGVAHNDVVAHAWLAETVRRSELNRRVGTVAVASVRRIQDVELLGLGPVAADVHADSRGHHPFDESNGAAAEMVRDTLERWRENLAVTFEVNRSTAAQNAPAPTRRTLVKQYSYAFTAPQPSVAIVSESLNGLAVAA